MTGKVRAHGSKTYHNMLQKAIQNSKNIDELDTAMIDIIDLWKIDPSLVPGIPQLMPK